MNIEYKGILAFFSLRQRSRLYVCTKNTSKQMLRTGDQHVQVHFLIIITIIITVAGLLLVYSIR